MVDIFRYGKDDMSKVFKRTQLDDSDYISAVDSIVKDVRNRGDEAVFEYCKKFDRQDIDASNILVTDEEIKRAYDKIDTTPVKEKNSTTNFLQPEVMEKVNSVGYTDRLPESDFMCLAARQAIRRRCL